MLVFVLLGRYSWKPAKNFIIWQKLYETYRNLDPVCFSGTIYNLWAPNAEFHVIYCIQIIQLLLSSISLLNIFVLPKSLIIIRIGPLRGVTYVQSLNFKTCRFSYWGGSHVAVRISPLYLCFFSMSLLQFQPIFGSFVAISVALCRCFKAMFCLSKFSPTGPKESGQNKCNQRRPTERWSYTKHYCTCSMGPMGLKSENEKRECEKKDDTIYVLYSPNKPDLPEKCSLNVTHLHPLTRGGASFSPVSVTG